MHAHELNQCSETAQSMNDEVTALVGRFRDVQLQNEDQQRCKILESVSAIDYGTKLNAILDQRQEGTGQWFLNSKEFQNEVQ